MSNAERLMEALGAVFTEGEVEMNAAVIEGMLATLAPIIADDFVTVMTGPDTTFEGKWTGPDGLREGWADWLETFGSVRFALESIEEVGDNVLTLGRQAGVSRLAGVELEQASAAVWKFRDGKIVQVEFHLDPERANDSAREPA